MFEREICKNCNFPPNCLDTPTSIRVRKFETSENRRFSVREILMNYSIAMISSAHVSPLPPIRKLNLVPRMLLPTLHILLPPSNMNC